MLWRVMSICYYACFSESDDTFITILETLTAVNRKIKGLWDVMLCSLVST